MTRLFAPGTKHYNVCDAVFLSSPPQLSLRILENDHDSVCGPLADLLSPLSVEHVPDVRHSLSGLCKHWGLASKLDVPLAVVAVGGRRN